MSKLAIITVHKGNSFVLEKTIKSVLSQNKKPQKFIIVAQELPISILKKYKNSFIKFIIGKDKSIYNAMNIGLNVTKKNSVIFLNSGDYFYDKNCVKYIYNAIKKDPKSINLFKVVLSYKKLLFYPKMKYFLSENYLPHPGFLRPSIIKKKYFIKFNEKFATISDGIWMHKNLKIFNKIKINKNLVIHELGGVSTIPTFKLMNEKKNVSLYVFFKELLKILLFNILDPALYYKLIYFKKFHLYEFKKK